MAQVRTGSYRRILVAVDNSLAGALATDAAIALGVGCGAEVAGIHVYAARLHDRRFTDMEPGLPPEYQHPKELQRQRDIHGSLIGEGLAAISNSYLDATAEKCRAAGIKFDRLQAEGKNYAELVRAVRDDPCDLVAMGVSGLGDTGDGAVGSTCLRVVRRVGTDCLVVRPGAAPDGRVVVAVDGSPRSFSGLRTALALARESGAEVEAVAAFDRDFHISVFATLQDVLSEEADRIFGVQRQKDLHDKIIDQGIAKIYGDHLTTAEGIAADEGVEINTKLLIGKPYRAVLDYLHERPAGLLVVGKLGVHADEGLDIGSNTENLLRLAPCNTLISSRLHPADATAPATLDAAG